MSGGWTAQRDALAYVRGVRKCDVPVAALELASLAAEGRIRTRQEEDGAAIAPEIWERNLTARWYEPKGGLELPGGKLISSDDIEFEDEGLRAAFPLADASAQQAPQQPAPPRGHGGRVPQYAWDRIVCEVIWRVHFDGVPRDISAFADDIFAWCESEFGRDNAPKDTMLRERITVWLRKVRSEVAGN